MSTSKPYPDTLLYIEQASVSGAKYPGVPHKSFNNLNFNKINNKKSLKKNSYLSNVRLLLIEPQNPSPKFLHSFPCQVKYSLAKFFKICNFLIALLLDLRFFV